MLNSEECKLLSSNSEKLKLAVDHWNLLGAEERVIWAERAKAVQSNDIHDLTVKQRTNQVKKGKKQLLSQLTYLESLGCEAVVLFLEPGDSCLQQFGTEKESTFE
ncbi:uncharacterized protein LOC124459290 [Xenia sp. Carnegie-2017]|uniref:uncharacterized protein LOC124459290 n=1 Tax=Xenia sp. Carnegie-2017 TaxID=2897299 RepID=UPI001F0344EB|nr:uncharacterized protein LOC124459290 [Xenia sp. Carnegie-2017]